MQRLPLPVSVGMGTLGGPGFFPGGPLLPQLRQRLFQVIAGQATLDGKALGQLGSQSLAGMTIRNEVLVVSGDAAVKNALTDIPLQQKPFDVLVAAHRVKRTAQGLVSANALHMGAQVGPFRVTAMKQLDRKSVV